MAAQVEALDACERFEGGYPISYRPLVFDVKQWVSWAPARGRVAARIALLEKHDQRRIYEEQKQLFEAVYEAHDVDLGVSSQLLTTGPDGGDLRSTSTWADGAHGLLPRSDEISFVHTEDDGGYWAVLADFAEAQRVLGPKRLKPLEGYDPPWYEVEGWPTPQELEAMHASRRYTNVKR